MPNYCVIVTNVSDHAARPPMAVGQSQVEHCSAPDEATAALIVQHQLSRFCDVTLYSWSIDVMHTPLPQRIR